MLLSTVDDTNPPPQQPSRDSETDSYGADYYANPFTNPEYTQTLKDLNVDQFIYDLVTKSADSNSSGKSLVASSKSIPMIYEGHTVIVESIVIQNLSVAALQGMETPQYFSEPGYLLSFLVAANDPLIALKIFAKGQGETGYSVADYSFRKMAMLGLGMTLGEAEELVYTEEGQTSRDLSGIPSTEHPYIKRYKHLPSGTETDYEVYKGTEDDCWMVAAYNPKLPAQFNTLFFDIYNGNATGPRLIHYLEIKRLIIVADKIQDDVPPYSHSILSLPQTSNPLADTPLMTDAPPPPPPTTTVTSSYAKLKRVDTNPFITKPTANIYSINKEQQNTNLFKDIMDANNDMFNDYVNAHFQEKKKSRRLV